MTIDTPARIAFLKKIHIFSGLEEDHFAVVAEQLEEVNIQEGEVVFKQDGPADSFYMIYGGSVRIIRRRDGKDYQLALLVRNDYFGELALVSNRRRSATVTAVQDTSLLILSRANFKKLFKDHPEIQNNLAVAVRSRQLAGRLRFKWLRQDEVVYFLTRKHPLVLYQKLIIPAFALLAPFALLYAWLTVVRTFVVVFAGGLSLLAIAAWIAWLVIDWGNDYYIVTNLRVVWLEKVIGIYDSRQESPLSMVVSVGVEANQFGRILDYGNVIVRTFVGRIVFGFVNHPNQAARMVEEFWQRTKEAAVLTEKEAMKDSIRKRLGIPIPARPAPDSDQPTTS
ncbi:MAG TPA: cyclic nucleotide-binding domain-containing protein, partial [Anaerolineales bacterium]|nr:cyclic nucleotide-binding domain-containing protein [Anaerolineales bacterium]